MLIVLEEENNCYSDTTERRLLTGRQHPLPTGPLEILRYALNQVEQTAYPDDEVPSIVRTRNILNEGIIFLKAEAPTAIP